MVETEYKGIPRNKIHWNPIINYDKCTTCGKCVDFCHTKAFRTEEIAGKKKTVVNPNRCIVFCHGCEEICPVDAITHPNEEKTQQIIDKLQKEKV